MPTDDDTTTSTTDDTTQTASPDTGSDTSGGDDGSAAPSSNGDAGTAPSSDSSATGTSSDASGGATAGSDGGGGSTPSSDSSATATSSDASGGATAGSDGGSSQTQTPAAQLKVDPVQAISLDPNPNLASAPSAGDTASTDSATADAAGADAGAAAGDAKSGGSTVGDIIAVGTTVAKIMAASAPDYSMRNAPASVLPKDADPLSLTGVLPDPQEMRVPLTYRNDMPSGMDLVFNLPIVVQWRCGGSYKGTGRYITGASMFLDSGTDTGAFYKVDVDASFANPFTSASNAGPVAGIDLLISIKVTDTISPNGLVVVLNGTIHGDGTGKISVRP